ncbi:uncharacterized protein [Ptychodera flava]|uniref:uncharacterized protein isoform X2 n=1 Tax=Ptychodera flava TaxID=63121 RepID=UPI003969D4B8
MASKAIDDLKSALMTTADDLKVDECKSLARKLGLTDVEIDGIEYRDKDAPEVKHQMLMKWLNKLGRDANMKILYHKLKENGNRQTADKIREKYMGDVGNLDEKFKELSVTDKDPGEENWRSKRISDLRFSDRHDLCLELNVENEAGKDWRLVADKLGYNDTLRRNFARHHDPTDHVLTAWSANENATVGRLYDILVDCKLTQAAAIIKPS